VTAPRPVPRRAGRAASRCTGLAAALAVVLVGTAAATPAAEPPAPRSLESLLAAFRALPGVSARFREERRIALLREPLVSSGTVYFAPPDRLVRHVERPIASTALIEGGELRFGAGGAQRSLDLEANSAVRGFVDGFRLLLAGDLAALRQLYEVHLEAPPGSEDAWELALRPSQEPLRTAIESIRISGRDRTLLALRIRERNGDETRMEFSDVRTDRRFSPAEIAELFRLPDP
jgi:outer membrane lipoprotein-sorting protein